MIWKNSQHALQIQALGAYFTKFKSSCSCTKCTVKQFARLLSLWFRHSAIENATTNFGDALSSGRPGSRQDVDNCELQPLDQRTPERIGDDVDHRPASKHHPEEEQCLGFDWEEHMLGSHRHCHRKSPMMKQPFLQLVTFALEHHALPTQGARHGHLEAVD